jgi:hypothetical protein
VRALAIVVAVAACAPAGQPLPEWTLDAQPVTLPLGPLSHHASVMTLTTTVAPDGRPGPHTLVLDCFHDAISLRANGIAVEDTGDTDVGEHRWVIADDGGSPLALELVAHRSHMFAIGISVVPVLAPGVVHGHGAVATFNHDIAIVELSLLGMMILLFAPLYYFERRRAHLAVALGGLVAAPAALWQLGLLTPLVGSLTPLVLMTTVCGIDLAILVFLYDTYDLGRVPRWLVTLLLSIPLASLGAHTSFAYAIALDAVTGAASCAVAVVAVPHVVRLLRSRHRRDATLMVTAFAIINLVDAPDLFGLTSGHALLGGLHTVSLGVVGVVITMALLLVHRYNEHRQSLQRTADELRHQVAVRSRELGDALAKIATQPQAPLAPDRTIDGRYRIVAKLGAGGMGAVYEVVRVTDGEHLALKTLRGRVDSELMARFAREAQIAAEISHRNLVPVLDVGIADGSLFLVMPLVRGGSLEQARAKFGDARWAAPILRQIAGGLAELHACAIIHRDLKPGNVLLSDEIARIADFGLATLRTNSLADTIAGSDETAPAGSPLTRAGDVFGTPGYMAPELAAGVQDATTASDVFALGVIAYEMLSGRAPFAEAPVMARMHGRAIVPPAADGIDPIVLRCLDLDPARRPPASEVAAASFLGGRALDGAG